MFSQLNFIKSFLSLSAYLTILLTVNSSVVIATTNNTEEHASPQKVVLKLDDLRMKNGHVHPGWNEVFEFLNQESIIGTIGIIGSSLEEGTSDYKDWIKARLFEGHELWNHGYCHCRVKDENGEYISDFKGKSFEEQLDNLQKTQAIVEKEIGITMQSFGAPYNATDTNTSLALERINDLKIWMYKNTKDQTSKQVLYRIGELNIEHPVHIPNLARLKQNFAKHKNQQSIILQGHPSSWVEDPKRMEEFKAMVRFLKSEGVEFVTATSLIE